MCIFNYILYICSNFYHNHIKDPNNGPAVRHLPGPPAVSAAGVLPSPAATAPWVWWKMLEDTSHTLGVSSLDIIGTSLKFEGCPTVDFNNL